MTSFGAAPGPPGPSFLSAGVVCKNFGQSMMYLRVLNLEKRKHIGAIDGAFKLK